MGTFRDRGRHDTSVRKQAQVCREVARTLACALSACDDALLNGLIVVDVEPFPDLARLRVWLSCEPVPALQGSEVHDRLERARGLLRSEMAAALERRRTPDLVFNLVSPDLVEARSLLPAEQECRAEEVAPTDD